MLMVHFCYVFLMQRKEIRKSAPIISKQFKQTEVYVCLFFCSLVFPNGLSHEFSLVTTFRLRKTTKKDRWLLWELVDHAAESQVWGKN